MTRIIGGAVGGRRVSTPRGSATRPTADRVREALFSAIESRRGSLSGLHFLDLYAGSGAVGLEAWSRGANRVTLVEADRRTARLVSANADALGFPAAQVIAAPVARVLNRGAPVPYDVVFSDPPYDLGDDVVREDLALLVSGGWLAPGALVILERARRGAGPAWPLGILPGTHKQYGDTTLWYGHAAQDQPADQSSGGDL
ncbi:MAG: 16S rRNA (guanine(966)-N(2))-methyltransferase RsmD [Nocardioides sp.]